MLRYFSVATCQHFTQNGHRLRGVTPNCILPKADQLTDVLVGYRGLIDSGVIHALSELIVILEIIILEEGRLSDHLAVTLDSVEDFLHLSLVTVVDFLEVLLQNCD